VCLDFKTFVCRQCRDVHMEFGHRTMSMSDPDWEQADINLVANKGGNKRATSEWLAFWNASEFPRPVESDEQGRRDFIRKAFVVKCWQRQPKKRKQRMQDKAPGQVSQDASTSCPDSKDIVEEQPCPQPETERTSVGAGEASPVRVPVLLPPPAPPAQRAMPVMQYCERGKPQVSDPFAGSACAEPPPSVAIQGEAWTADFAAFGSPSCPSRGIETLLLDAPAAVGSCETGVAPTRPAMPAAPSYPGSPMPAALSYPGSPVLKCEDEGQQPKAPLTPRTKPFQSSPGTLGSQNKALADRFAAFDDMSTSEEQAPPPPVEFGDLLSMFNERTEGWEAKGVSPAPKVADALELPITGWL
jgi:hypothetical protein